MKQQREAPQVGQPGGQGDQQSHYTTDGNRGKGDRIAEIVRKYFARGWQPIPIPLGEKGRRDKGWQKKNYAEADFNGHNIGVILGPRSNGLTDIDLDCAEAIALAPYFLPKTEAIFGRHSKPRSHHEYIVKDSYIETAAKKLEDENGAVICELRLGVAKAALTVFPGSVHASGERIEWVIEGEPAKVSCAELDAAVTKIAVGTLLVRHWPSAGRHEACLRVGGFLARAGWEPDAIGDFVEVVQHVAHAAREDGRRAAFDAATLYSVEGKGYGIPALAELFGKAATKCIAKIVGYRDRTVESAGELKSARASSIEITAVDWLWRDRFALGKLGIIAGLPDEGKGQVFADMAARVTRGNLQWPCNEGYPPCGNVILLTAEDDPSDTVVPRLMAAGADLNRIEIVQMVRSAGRDRMFSLVTDLELLRKKIVEVGDVKMVQIDPISAYLGVGKIDSFRSTDVRAVLAPLVDLSIELKVAIVAIMHFNKKLDVTNVLLRISDSVAFGATARHVYAVINDAENKRKLFVKGKNNLAPFEQRALAFTFEECEVGTDKRNGRAINAPHIVWHTEYVDVTAQEAMQAATEAKSPAARDSAKKFLSEALARGPMGKTEIEQLAEANMISDRTLRRAKQELNVAALKDGPNGTWRWHLPGSAAGGSGQANLGV
jgi:putative DNA primase/helicase